MLPTAHLPAPTSLVLLPLPSPLLLVDMLVLDVMSPTPLELSMLPSVRLRPRLTLLSFMEPTDMLDTDMLVTDMLVSDMLVLGMLMLDILMPLTVLDMPATAHLPAHTSLVLLPLPSLLLLVDMLVLLP